jgi:hypothetical protein
VNPSPRHVLPASRQLLATIAVLMVGACLLNTAHADCIPSIVSCNQTQSEPTTPTYTTWCESPVFGLGTATYDFPAGTMFLSNSDGTTEINLRDEYTISGPAPGASFSLTLRVHFTGWAYNAHNYEGSGGRGFVEARPLVVEPGDVLPYKAFGTTPGVPGRVDYADSIDLVMNRTAGAPLGIEIHSSV